MRETLRITWDLETGEVVEHIWRDYAGPVALCKGGQSKKAAAAAEQQRQEQNAIMRDQLALQREQLAKVTGGVSQYLTPGGQGFTPEALAAMRGQAIEGTTSAFEDARKQLMLSLASRGGAGGELPVGGDYLRNLGSFNAELAKARSQALQGVNIQDALQSLQNRFSAGNLLLGAGSEYNPAPFISGSSSALGAQVNAAANADQASSGLGGALLGGIFGVGSRLIKPRF